MSIDNSNICAENFARDLEMMKEQMNSLQAKLDQILSAQLDSTKSQEESLDKDDKVQSEDANTTSEEDNTSVAIYLATHTTYTFPEDDIFIPMQAGASICNPLGYASDNTGANISEWNRNFCELTVSYWAWKNATADIVGIGHYRRIPGDCGEVYTKKEIVKLLKEYDAILPGSLDFHPNKNAYEVDKQMDQDVPGGSTYTQYRKNHEIIDMDLAWMAIRRLYPEYEEDFVNTIVFGTLFIPTNIVIAKKEVFDAYHTWLFNILFFVKKYSPYELYEGYQSRVFGFLSERLMALYFYHNKLKCASCCTIDLEEKENEQEETE